MNTNKNESLLLANESVILRIVSFAKIIGWIILAFYLISFLGDVRTILQGQVNWPTGFLQWLLMIVNIFFTPAIGLFYFLILHGLAQGLNLGLDIYYELHPEEDDQPEAL